MLNKIEINNPNAIQKYFCEPFEKLVPTQELQREQDRITSELFMTVGAMPVNMDTDSAHSERMKDLMSIGGYADTERCFKLYSFSYTLDFRSKFFISFLCEQLHDSWMYINYYLTYLQYVAFKNHIKHIDFIYLCEKVFPYGTPLVKDIVDLVNSTQIQTHHCEEPNGRSILSYHEKTMASIIIISPDKVAPPTEKKDDDWSIMNVMKRFK